MVGGNAGFERGEHENLAVTGNLEDRAAAVADVQVFILVGSDSGGDSHAFGVGRHGAVAGYAVNRAVEARRDVHHSRAVKCDGGGVHHIGQKRLDRVVGVDLEDGHWDLLSPG